MIFTSAVYVYFLAAVLLLYWCTGRKEIRNALLLVASYVFYGWIHPWFCILLASSTIVDYCCGLLIARFETRKRLFLMVSLGCNLGLLGFFKYFNFFADNVRAVLSAVGLDVGPVALQIFLPVGISFYTFQTLSYTIEVYRGNLEPRRNFIDFAVFVAFFPQLVAGPIERASHLLPQIEVARKWDPAFLGEAFTLFVRGYLKKLFIADNVSFFADKIFMLGDPSLPLLFAGTVAFAVQIYSDFSAYTDIARGSARLMGFDIIKNFNRPYVAISPSDFWRRWHISFSSWIRDYLYIPLGGSRTKSWGRYAVTVLVTMGLAGLWHGAAWNFVIWGLYHGVLLFVYHRIGKGGRWQPQGWLNTAVAWCIMSIATLFGWFLFRAPDMGWALTVLHNLSLAGSENMVIASGTVLTFLLFYASPLFAFRILDRRFPDVWWLHCGTYAVCLVLVMVFSRGNSNEFIYFQF